MLIDTYYSNQQVRSNSLPVLIFIIIFFSQKKGRMNKIVIEGCSEGRSINQSDGYDARRSLQLGTSLK